MANKIYRVHKLVKQKRKGPDIATNLPTVYVSISKCHNANGKNIDMKIESSSTKKYIV